MALQCVYLHESQCSLHSKNRTETGGGVGEWGFEILSSICQIFRLFIFDLGLADAKLHRNVYPLHISQHFRIQINWKYNNKREWLEKTTSLNKKTNYNISDNETPNERKSSLKQSLVIKVILYLLYS